MTRVTDTDMTEWARASDSAGATGEHPAAGRTQNLASVGFIGAALRRRARLWCAAALAGFLVGLGVYLALPPAYQASTSVLLAQSPNESPADVLLTDLALAQSRPVAEAAMAQLGLRRGVDSFRAAYTVAEVTDRLILFTVSAPSSSQAVLRAQALAAQFLRFRAAELQVQQTIAVATLHRQLTQAMRQAGTLAKQVAGVLAHHPSRARHAAPSSLRTEQKQANIALSGLQQAAAGYPVITASMVAGSQVLDTAAPIDRSRRKLAVIYAGMGLVAGLALGLSLVVVPALASDRLRRRGDIATALGVPVSLSVGGARGGSWLPGRRGAGLTRDRGAQRIAARLHAVLPEARRGAAALAVVCVDNASVVAQSLVSLAVSCAREGSRVLVADLAEGSPAARRLGARTPGLTAVSVGGTQLTVVIPDRQDVPPEGPVGRVSPQATPSGSAALAAAYASADLLLTLTSLDPSLGAEHLTSWATDAVAVVTAGRSSATQLRTAGEALRLAELPRVSAILIGADKTDESIGVARTAARRRRPAPRLGIVGR